MLMRLQLGLKLHQFCRKLQPKRVIGLGHESDTARHYKLLIEQHAFKKHKQLFEYQHLVLLKDNW
jgi:hypothetical protein